MTGSRDGDQREAGARERRGGGVRRATAVLISSLTGRPFYARNGYVADGEPQAKFGLRDVFPMSKRLLT